MAESFFEFRQKQREEDIEKFFLENSVITTGHFFWKKTKYLNREEFLKYIHYNEGNVSKHMTDTNGMGVMQKTKLYNLFGNFDYIVSKSKNERKVENLLQLAELEPKKDMYLTDEDLNILLLR